MLRLLKGFERGVVMALLVMLMIVVLFATVELGVVMIAQALGRDAPALVLDFKEMLNIFGFFLLVLIGLELAETVYAYLDEEKIHVEVVFLVAMVAVARKIIILDYGEASPALMYGVATVTLSLTLGYYLLKRTMREDSIAAGEAMRTSEPDRPPRKAGS